MASSLYQQGLFNLITAKSVRRRQALRDRLIAYRKQFEHDGRALLHFRFPRLQKVHAFTDGVLIAVTCVRTRLSGRGCQTNRSEGLVGCPFQSAFGSTWSLSRANFAADGFQMTSSSACVESWGILG